MIITCEACNTSFNLDDKMVKPTGSKVRCSVCKKVFTAFPPQVPVSEEPAEPEAPSVHPEADHESSAADTSADQRAVAALGAAEALLDSDGDLDLEPDLEPAADAAGGGIEAAVSQALDEDLDLSFADGETDEMATVIANLDDDLDLDGDFSLEPEADAAPSSSLDGELTDSLDDIDDLDFGLGEDDTADQDVPPADGLEASLEDLSLDFDVDAGAEDDDQGFDEDELTLALDMEPREDVPAEAEAESSMLEDDLDLSSLENLLSDDDSGEEPETAAVNESETSDLSLDLADDLNLESDTVEGPASGPDDLSQDLDADGKNVAVDLNTDDDLDQDVDLSEIEKMLEEPDAGDSFSSVPEQDLELDIEASLETEKWMSDSVDDNLIEDEEFDLSELEQAIDDVDVDAEDETLDDPELELDIGDGDEFESAGDTVAVDSELDFDLSDFEDDISTEADDDEPADMELEFEVEEDASEDSWEADGLEETVAVVEEEALQTEKAEKPVPEPVVEAAPAAASKPTKPVKPVRKKGVSKPLIVVLILAVLVGGGYGVVYYLTKAGIEIPFVSDYLKPKAKDPGNLKLNTHDINSKFIENANLGKLFVISGQVKNGYPENRGMIRLVGKIFSAGKVLVQEEKVYCGNVMSDLELANLEWAKIKARLSNRLGDNRSNVKIAPGKSIHFQVVFSGLPDELEEFTIEIVGSTALK